MNQKLIICGSESNDLCRVLAENGIRTDMLASPAEAVKAAPAGAGVMILAEGYPDKTTAVESAVFQAAKEKGLRLYIEFPSVLPDMAVGPVRATKLERVVVSSDVFGDSLARMQLLAIHGCRFVEVRADNPCLVAAKVAGFDTAVCGLDDVEQWPILFEHPAGGVLVSTTKLSQFVTARYGTIAAMQAVWKFVLGWLRPGKEAATLSWTPSVRPTFGRGGALAPGAARRAVARGIDWHTNAKMLLGADWQDRYVEDRASCLIRNAPCERSIPKETRSVGEGEFGLLEGFSSQIDHAGNQPVRWWLRTDSVGESSLAFALRWKLDGDERSRRIAANLLDWVYFNSPFYLDDPGKPNFGLILWGTGTTSLYQDNDVKVILGCLGTAAILGVGRWDRKLVQNILANFRTTGVCGFRGANLKNDKLLAKGWQNYWNGNILHFSPHLEAWIWGAYLWLYDKTGYRPLLERTRGAIRLMMEAYPDNWRWTNGIQQERGRMLLTLAWLVRVDDQAEHRAWLRRIANDMRKSQVSCGAIREELGNLDKGLYRPPRSNAEYGAREAPLIEKNGDPVADMLYTCNFAFLGLHEAAAATGEPIYREMEDALAEFLVRIQVASSEHPELDGGWFRAFDFDKWEYWGSNADVDWGAWCIECGWTQAWIPTVLALRELNLNLWDLSRNSAVGKHFDACRELMLPGMNP